MKSKDDGKILPNQRISKVRKTTNSRQTTNDDVNNEEHKMEEDDLHTTGDARNNSDDVTITPTQRIVKIQKIDSSRHTTDDNVSNQEQKMEEIDSHPMPATLPWPNHHTYIDDLATTLPLTLQYQITSNASRLELQSRTQEGSEHNTMTNMTINFIWLDWP